MLDFKGQNGFKWNNFVKSQIFPLCFDTFDFFCSLILIDFCNKRLRQIKLRGELKVNTKMGPGNLKIGNPDNLIKSKYGIMINSR